MALLQSVHIVKYADDTNDKLFATTGTVCGIQNNIIDRVTAATAAQIAVYPNALTQINTRYFRNSQQLTGTILVTEAVAAVIAAS